MKNTGENGWWNLYIDGKILTSVRGRDRAIWFLEQMKRADPLAHWELTPRDKNSNVKPITPEAIRMRREVVYCVGSD